MVANNKANKLNDDYLGALLRVQGVPNEVVICLLKTNNCNVDGLRSVLNLSQGKCAKKLAINVDLLDGLPHKVTCLFIIYDQCMEDYVSNNMEEQNT
jgi:hypothetical protein